MSKPDALLPCPFCGSFGLVRETLDNTWYAACRVDDCVEYGTHWLTEAEAITAWNRRAGQSHTDGLVAALERLRNAGAALLREADRAGLAENWWAQFGNGSGRRDGTSIDQSVKDARRAMNEMRATLAAAKGQQQ